MLTGSLLWSDLNELFFVNNRIYLIGLLVFLMANLLFTLCKYSRYLNSIYSRW